MTFVVREIAYSHTDRNMVGECDVTAFCTLPPCGLVRWKASGSPLYLQKKELFIH